ncbi:MAG: hypothetical protein K2R98_29730 [Gemmataceae bacterium]|nr:hypothetical protein [Gemmataceae bacterium]
MADSSMYPRGIPYKPPPPEKAAAEKSTPDPASTEAGRSRRTVDRPPQEPVPQRSPDPELRRWILRLALATVAAIALIAGGSVYLITHAIRSATQAGANPKPETSPAPPTTALAYQPDTKPIAKKPPEVSADPKEKADPAVLVQRDRAMDAVGGLMSAHLYQTYLNIGFLGDGVGNDIYDEADARKWLKAIRDLIETVDAQLKRLADAGLEGDDLKRIENTRQLNALLRVQARELLAYWDVPEKDKEKQKEQEAKYHKARDDAWKGIKELLEIKD